jgi:hypothetical protein
MKKIINAAILVFAALLLFTDAQAQERIDLSKEGDLKAIKFTLKEGETKNFVVQLPKDKYLYVYFLDPSFDTATNPTVKVDSAQSSYAGAPGTTSGEVPVPKAKVNWELTNSTAQKIFAGSDVKMETPQIPADGDYSLTLKCVTYGGCLNWLRVKVEKTAPSTEVKVDFP